MREPSGVHAIRIPFRLHDTIREILYFFRLDGVIIGTGLGCLLIVVLLGVVIQTFCETNCCRLDLDESTDGSIEDTSQHQREPVDKPNLRRIRLWIHKHFNQV